MEKTKRRCSIFSAALILLWSESMASPDKVGVVASNPSLSPNGAEVVFSADFDGQDRIWVANTDGNNLRKISKTSDRLKTAETEPVWSPDGNRIAYTAGAFDASDIWLMSIDGAQPVRLTANGANNRRAAWSPDGKKIVFVSDKNGTNDIWIMNADGSAQRRLIALPGQENSPSFSPDGSKIVFSEAGDDSDRLMIANADGSNVRPLTSAGFQDWQPTWGQNGIVFVSNRSRSLSGSKLWTVQPDGSGLRAIGDISGFDPVIFRGTKIFYTEAINTGRALSAIAAFNPATNLKQIVVDVQGFFTPIDIRPGQSTNRLNPFSNGRIEVAILSTRTFDVTRMVDPATVSFGAKGSEASLYKCSSKYKDVNGDGLLDLRCQFWLKKAAFRGAEKQGVLRFVGKDGMPYEGRDAITIVTSGEADDVSELD